ncbi:FadR family transcriptional regulator [Planosporangium thailandense]|uniref:FadR family transcriptional regulator n=1 Tax=Planosporangium thailandense TaxID=765197 RepID=A0ABX0XVY4_9ACTN|nr:FCD domain-containing protein [Planosporangium thailandense]NJC70057.1 FadR family transcriptional regulator [Planosporangium thailandense]
MMTVANEAVIRIKHMIASGELSPGSRLPSQDDLAYRMGLSRSALREAVRSLTAMNVLVSRQGDGTYVSSLRTPLLLRPLGFAADILPDDELVQLLDLRAALEPYAAALAAARITTGDAEALSTLVRRGAPDAPVSDFLDADLALHRRIVELSGNEAVATLVEAISPPALQPRILGTAPPADLRAATYDDHLGIVAALTTGDAEAARVTAAAHVANVRRHLLRTLACDGSLTST